MVSGGDMISLNIFWTAIFVIITVFVLGIIWMIGEDLVSARLYPLFYSFAPADGAAGIPRTSYIARLDHIKLGMRIFFYILIAIPFIYLLIKYFYEKEETSTAKSMFGW